MHDAHHTSPFNLVIIPFRVAITLMPKSIQRRANGISQNLGS